MRYQVAQGRNYEVKNPKKTVGGEKSFAQKENFEKEGGTSKPYSGKESQGKKDAETMRKRDRRKTRPTPISRVRDLQA